MNELKLKKKPHFKVKETGYHRSAKVILASWVNGEIEKPFYVEDKIAFVPDVTVYKDGIIQCIYEVVYTHPLTALKYGMIQYWCHRNVADLTVFEVSADYILRQTEKPDRIEAIECYIVNPFEYEEFEDILINI